MEKVIEVSGLTKKYGDFTAVDQLDLSIARGEIFGLLGPNGAGKSTTILMMMGLTEPERGTIRVCGIDPVHNPIKVKRKVGYMPEDVGFYDDYPGIENLVYTARLNGIAKNEAFRKASSLLKRVGLGEEMNKKVGNYSKGMRQRLGLADVLIKNPEVIILDEPTLGIDPSGVREFLELIVDLSRIEKITVLFSSHHLHQVQQVCDRVGIFVRGKLLAEGDIESLSKKLFSENNHIIEAEVDITVKRKQNGTESMEGLMEGIKKIKGVSSVKLRDSKFTIESQEDISTRVSEYIVTSGFGLSSLSRKIYGLDEIYHRYFEGTTVAHDTVKEIS